MENLKKTKDKNILRKIFRFIEYIIMLIVFFICTVIIVQRLSNNETAFLGYRIFRIETGSMIPKYNIADVILVKETDVNTIKVGDDLVYLGEQAETTGKIVTHQVVRIEKDKEGNPIFHTKGIANKKEDPEVSSDQVKGIVKQKIYSLSLIMNLILNRYTMYFVIILPLTIYIFFMELYGKEKKIRDRIKERNRKAQEREEKERQKAKQKQEKIKKRGQIMIGTKEIKRIGTREVPKTESKPIAKTEKKEPTKKQTSKKGTKNKKNNK